MRTEWKSFTGGAWEKEINVRDFIQQNYTPYKGDGKFLKEATEDTKDLWQQVLALMKEEREKGGVLDMDTKTVSTITSHGPGYLDKDKEKIVGLQTDKPLKRSMQPYGGIRMAVKPARTMATMWTLRLWSISPLTERRTMPVCLMPTPLKCVPAVPIILSPDYRMPTAEGVSSATTEGLPSTVWTA